MDYTQSNQFSTHAPTGQRLHQESRPVPTAMSEKDFNSVIWSLMEIVKAGGKSGIQFDPDTPASYQVLRDAVQTIVTTASGDVPGRVSIFMRPTAPPGWLPMSGLLLSRTVYPALWAHVQTVGAVTEAAWTAGQWGWFSAGDGSTTFRIPDLRAMVLRGLDDGRGLDLARLIGSYQASQNLAHTHGVTDPTHSHGVNNPAHSHTIADPGHLHTIAGAASGGGGLGGGDLNGAGGSSNTGSSATGVSVNATATNVSLNAAATGITVNSAGGTETRVANIALPFYLKF